MCGHEGVGWCPTTQKLCRWSNKVQVSDAVFALYSVQSTVRQRLCTAGSPPRRSLPACSVGMLGLSVPGGQNFGRSCSTVSGRRGGAGKILAGTSGLQGFVASDVAGYKG